ERESCGLGIGIIRVDLGMIHDDLIVGARSIERYSAAVGNSESHAGCVGCPGIDDTIYRTADRINLPVFVDTKRSELFRRALEYGNITSIQHQDLPRAIVSENIRAERQRLLVTAVHITARNRARTRATGVDICIYGTDVVLEDARRRT